MPIRSNALVKPLLALAVLVPLAGCAVAVRDGPYPPGHYGWRPHHDGHAAWQQQPPRPWAQRPPAPPAWGGYGTGYRSGYAYGYR